LGVLNQGKAFEAWKKLSEITGATKAWISKSKAILERVNTKNLSDVDIEKLKNYYSSHQMPTTCATRPRCTFQGDGFTVNFDDYGHARFESFVPEMSGVGKTSYNPDAIRASGGTLPTSNKPTLMGSKGTDIADANRWASNNFPPSQFQQISLNGTCKIKNPTSPYADINGWVECVWHHHEDGRNLIPVPVNIHNKAVGGAGHTGGQSVIDKDIKDFFPSLTF